MGAPSTLAPLRPALANGAACVPERAVVVPVLPDAVFVRVRCSGSREDEDFLGGVLHVVRQVKLLRGRPVFAPPKGGKERDVPLPESITFGLVGHLTHMPAAEVTLPWKTLDGPPVTAALIFRSPEGHAPNRNRFNDRQWRPALRAAGVAEGRDNGMHALRHFYAWVLLDAGESTKALSEYRGHHDPGFTLRT